MHFLSLDANQSCFKARARIGGGLYIIAVLLFLLLSSGRGRAQISTAQLSGTVLDPTSSVISGAEVAVTQTATGVSTTTTTNEQGIFVLPSLAVGPYTIQVSAPGFTGYRQTNLVLTVGQQLSLTIRLKVGAEDQSVTVTADSVAIDSQTPTQQATVEQEVVQELPLNGRNPATLTYTVAGVTDVTLSPAATGSNSTVKEWDAVNPAASAPSVHGARAGGTYFSLDGASNTDPFTVIGGPFPNPDATQEFSVVTGTYGARYVSAPGGAINIVTKAGTNQIHGSVFEFLRNGYFNACNRFCTTPDVLKRNQFGFAAGGPIISNRLFVFGSYQGSIVHSGGTGLGIFPTARQATGDFGTFTIPQPMLSPAIQRILKYLPVGDPNTGQASYPTKSFNSDQQSVVRLDYTAGAHKIFARGFYDRYVSPSQGPSASGGVMSEGEGQIMPWGSYSAGDTWARGNWLFSSQATFLQVLADSTVGEQLYSFKNMGLNNMSGYGADPGYSLLYTYPYFYSGNGSVAFFPRREFQASEDVAVVKGKHQISFGADYRHVHLLQSNFTGQNPVAVFVGANAYIYGLLGYIPGATMNPMADFLLGAPYYFQQGDGHFAGADGNLFGLYGEDNIRLTTKLAATVGVRWDPYLPYEPKYVNCFVPGVQSTVYSNAPKGLIFPGDPGCSSTGMHADMKMVEPRVGLAYQLDSKGRLAVRSGFGMYSLQLPLNSYGGFGSEPFVRSFQVSQFGMSIDHLWASLGTEDPFASGFHTSSYKPSSNATFQTAVPSAIATFDKNFEPSYVEQWSLSMDWLMSSRDSVEVAYNGNAGMHLTMGVSLNTPVYNTGLSLTENKSTEQARRPYQGFSNISDFASIGTSSFNGVDVTYKHRDKIFMYTSAFSWAKSLDTVSSPVRTGDLNAPDRNHSFHRGLSDFDQNYVFRNTLIANGPKFQNWHRAARTVAGSWQLSALVVADAGLPFGVYDGNDASATGLSFEVADRVSEQPLYLSKSACIATLNHSKPSCLNPAAFSDTAANTFGTSGRNSLRAAPYKDVDIALIKEFPVVERVSGQFRAEAFNSFNHPNLVGPPNATYGQTGFGEYTTARDPRIMQFSLKLSF
jgi:hypothetical protein